MRKVLLITLLTLTWLGPHPWRDGEVLAQSKSKSQSLTIDWSKNYLTVQGDEIPGKELKIWYLEAFCRPGSTDRDWHETVIPHQTRLVEKSSDSRMIKLQSKLEDGVIVDHLIKAGADEVDFLLTATNPTKTASEAHWGQSCVHVASFVGVPEKHSAEEYLPQSFIFVDGKLTKMPVEPWAKKARYIPGQVWAPKHVNRNDVNPRPLSSVVPSNGLIGCFSKDGKKVFATAWEPYQELFQGVIVCLHSDFRLGGLKPGETKTLRGKVYLTDANIDKLLERYRKDFPEHKSSQ